MATGTTKWFSETKGFGLTAQEDDEPDVFVHHSEIKTSAFKSLKEGNRVIFKIGLGPKGPTALNVTISSIIEIVLDKSCSFPME